MNKIKSFEADHTKISEGIYISRTDASITTYDIRMIKPNTPPYLENAGIHTFEHLFATYVRNSVYSKNVVYVGPMGCRTGFYFLTISLAHKDALQLVKNAMNFISEFSGEIPGATQKECGNFKEHDLNLAKTYAQKMACVLKDWNESNLNY